MIIKKIPSYLCTYSFANHKIDDMKVTNKTVFKFMFNTFQVKVWFQNRRTKYKRDVSREAEVKDARSESMAACNIMKLLQPPPNQVQLSLPPYMLPYPTFAHGHAGT